MSDGHRKTVEDYYQQALDLPEGDRTAFIANNVPEPIRGKVRALVEHYAAARDSFLRHRCKCRRPAGDDRPFIA